MSQEELVSAYVEGSISRRTMIRRLVAGGATLGAATAYAQLLAPQAEAGELDPQNEYPRTFVRILSPSLDHVLRKGRLRVRYRTAGYNRNVRLSVFAGKALIGEHRVDAYEATRLDLGIKLDDMAPLEGVDRVRIRVLAEHLYTGEVPVPLAEDVKPLRRKPRRR